MQSACAAHRRPVVDPERVFNLLSEVPESGCSTFAVIRARRQARPAVARRVQRTLAVTSAAPRDNKREALADHGHPMQRLSRKTLALSSEEGFCTRRQYSKDPSPPIYGRLSPQKRWLARCGPSSACTIDPPAEMGAAEAPV